MISWATYRRLSAIESRVVAWCGPLAILALGFLVVAYSLRLPVLIWRAGW